MSHLIADTSQELAQVELDLNIPPGSVQNTNTPKEHLDICESKRTAAIARGAKPVTSRELVQIIRRKQRELAEPTENLNAPATNQDTQPTQVHHST